MKISTVVRRFCPLCNKWTRSVMDAYGNEVCTEHNDSDER